MIAWNLYLLVRGEFARQRIAAGLSQRTLDAAGFRWSNKTRDADVVDAPTVVMIHGFTGSKELVSAGARILGRDRPSFRPARLGRERT